MARLVLKIASLDLMSWVDMGIFTQRYECPITLPKYDNHGIRLLWKSTKSSHLESS